MPWDQRLINPVTLGFAGDPQADAGLSSAVDLLIAQQVASWAALAEGVNALQRVETRALSIEGTKVILQHNPGRIISTSARVDESSILERPCFLCSANMPDEERGLAFGSGFAVFCNPFPVLENHLVVVSKKHEPQRLAGSIETLLELARTLGPEYVALYNGPKCGASAPDHVHFQAGLAANLPVLKEIPEEPTGDWIVSITATCAYCAGFLVVRGKVPARMVGAVEQMLQAIADISGSNEDEPLVNVIATHDVSGWRVIIFPRERHRPSAYYHQGANRIVVSPAAVDLAGLVVVPREADYIRLAPSDVASIFSEVTFGPERMEALANLVGVDRVSRRRDP